MINFVALPLIVAIAIALLGSRVLDRLQPATAARRSSVLLAAVPIAAVPTLWLIGLSGLAHLGLRNPVIDWSHHLLPDYRPVGAIVGSASLVAAIAGTVRAGRVALHYRRLRCTETGPLEIIETDEIYAYTMPGPAATIAISTGLRNALADDEYNFVVAHEQAHGRHRHDRYKLLALLATAFVPPMQSVTARLDYYIERWADEESLATTGAERRLAARTIAKVALAATSPTPALGIADRGAAARAHALLAPVDHPAMTIRIQSALIIGITVSLAAYQLHHSMMFGLDIIR